MVDRETLLHRAQAMRSGQTMAEAALWKLVRGRRLGGLKFRRQHRLGPYLADFACLWPRLVVEADGGSHQNPEYDARRDAWMRAQGFTVLRFSNELCIEHPEEVSAAILRAVGRR